jgi:GLPGLI family protein
MKFFLISLIFSFSFYSVHGQNNSDKISEVLYTFYIDTGKTTVSTDCSLICAHNARASTFINFGFKEIPKEESTSKTDIDGAEFIRTEKFDTNNGQKPEYQKYYRQDSLFAYESVYGEKRYHIIKEMLPSYSWKIQTETKTMLKVRVQKATVTFRGRDYEAWFAPSIPISDGPYKFHGLPGLILEIGSVDGRFKFEAYALNLYQSNKDFDILKLSEKYRKSTTLNLKQKLELAEKNKEKEIKYQLSKNPNTQDYKIENTGIETEFPNYEN